MKTCTSLILCVNVMAKYYIIANLQNGTAKWKNNGRIKHIQTYTSPSKLLFWLENWRHLTWIWNRKEDRLAKLQNTKHEMKYFTYIWILPSIWLTFNTKFILIMFDSCLFLERITNVSILNRLNNLFFPNQTISLPFPIFSSISIITVSFVSHFFFSNLGSTSITDETNITLLIWNEILCQFTTMHGRNSNKKWKAGKQQKWDNVHLFKLLIICVKSATNLQKIM